MFSVLWLWARLTLPPARGLHRHHLAGVKDTQWARDRKGLEQMQGTANEARGPAVPLSRARVCVNPLIAAAQIVLVADDGVLVEGLQSNFYAVKDGALFTAVRPDVLPGTIRKMVLRTCDQHHVRVDTTGPALADLPCVHGGARVCRGANSPVVMRDAAMRCGGAQGL